MQFTAPFAKELNQIQSMADLVSFLGPKDRRFCSEETFTFLRDSKTAASNVTRWQASCTCEVPPSRFDFIPREGSNGWDGGLVDMLRESCKCFAARTGGIDEVSGAIRRVEWSTPASVEGQ